MREAASWLIEQGSPLWNVNELTPERVITPGLDVYLAKIDGEIAGTIILQEHDDLFWPEVTDGRSLFFHKLAVRRKYAGKGVSSALIEHALLQAKARGKSHLRMDCSAKHPPLRVFYEKHGFQWIDQKVAGPWFVDRMLRSLN